MSTATDTLKRFLDIFEDTLDDRQVTADAVAARLHLSRFYFDRLVSSAAGEPPGRLRRRILLERAAYRLITTNDDVLGVSLDAGYASHEAFTRAFTRAFGRAPSHWRRQPRSFLIGEAGRVHFNPPGSLSLPAERTVTGMDLLIRMVDHHVWLVGEMVERADGLNAETLDRPVEISVDGVDRDPTLRSLLSRLVGQLAMWDAATHERSYDFAVENHESVGSMRVRLAEVGPAFVGRVRTIVDEGRLDETFVDATCDPPRVFTYAGMVAHVLTFAAHRRTLVCGALADAGVEDLGSGDPMRWVAEHA
jgi:AraC family transcriptional regulator